MIKEYEGTSELALMAEHLPVRGRDGLALIVAELALDHLKPLVTFPIAQKAFELARRSFDGEAIWPAPGFVDTILS